ncbi:MAG: glycosyltransferase family 87 protein [Sciscionella sp.]
MSAGVSTASRHPRQHPPRYLSGATLAAAVAVSAGFTTFILLRGLDLNPYDFMDLAVYREGVQAWWQSTDMYGTLPPTPNGYVLPFIYPPFAALVLSPLAAMPWTAAWLCAGVVSLASLGVVVWIVSLRVWPEGGHRGAVLSCTVIVPLSLFLEPVQETLWYGQVNLLLMAMVAADCLVEQPRWPRGLLIGLAAAVKLTPAGFVLMLLLRKDFRASAVAVGSALLATAIGFAVNWHGSLRFFFDGSTGLGQAANTPYATNQTIKAALERMNLPIALQNGLWLGLAAIVVALGVIGIRRAVRAGRPALAMAITAALLLTCAPTAWGHHWVYVVPALLVLLGHGIRRTHSGWLLAFAAMAAAFVLAPFYWCPVLTSPVDHRMHWSTAQHFYGNTYVILTVLSLLAYALPAVLAWRSDRASGHDTTATL